MPYILCEKSGKYVSSMFDIFQACKRYWYKSDLCIFCLRMPIENNNNVQSYTLDWMKWNPIYNSIYYLIKLAKSTRFSIRCMVTMMSANVVNSRWSMQLNCLISFWYIFSMYLMASSVLRNDICAVSSAIDGKSMSISFKMSVFEKLSHRNTLRAIWWTRTCINANDTLKSPI